MKFLPSEHNILRTATVTASDPVGSESFDREVIARSGGGLVQMTGAYTGQTDAVFEVEIRNDTISGTPRVSTPASFGVGNAAMTDVSADPGAAAQRITITLASLGTETRNAYTPFQGKKLQAKSPGADANAIQIEISEAGVTRGATDSALLSDLIAGSNDYVGDQWDFGGPPRNPDGTIPASAPRLSFGQDPAVYRQYKDFSNGQYHYAFTPVPLRNVPTGAAVKAVSGGRTMTVTHTLGAAAPAFVPGAVYALGDLVKPTTPDGHWHEVTDAGTASTEPTWSTTGGTVTSGGVEFTDRGQYLRTYTGIVTLYDALDAIQDDADSLIEVADAVVLDYNPGGMAITDLSVRTSAYIQSIERDGSDNVRRSELQASIAATAPTEQITLRCAIAGTLNGEVWDVSGSVSGLLAQVVTGVPFVNGPLSATIPLLPVPTVAPTTTISTDFKPTTDGEPLPAACVTNAVLGSMAQAFEFQFRMKKRVAACDCDGTTVNGGPNPIFLGTDPEVSPTVDTLDSEIKTRVQRSASWYSAFTTDNTSIAVSGTSYPVEITPGGPGNTTQLDQSGSALMKVDIIDILAAFKLRSMMCKILIDLKAEFGTDPIPTAATDLWDDLQDIIEADLADLSDNAGAGFWYDLALQISVSGSGGSVEDSIPQYKRLFTTEFGKLMHKYEALRDDIYLAADRVPPSFDSPTGDGSGPWSDIGGPYWFECINYNLMPIQPGQYYHACHQVVADDGTVTYVSDFLFGLGLAIGCPENLKEGDLFIVRIGDTGSTVRGYQQNDRFDLRVINGSPVQLGGGQTGDDTQVWAVVAEPGGAKPDYAMYKPAPALYSVGAPGEDIDFKIAPGTVPSDLGDRFVIYIEGGEFRVRRILDGVTGSWSADTAIADTVDLDPVLSTTDGVALAFDRGIAPSFVPLVRDGFGNIVSGDAYRFTAYAENGGHNLASLTKGGITTTEKVESMITLHRIEANLADAGLPAEPVTLCAILFKTSTEVGATVTLRGYALASDTSAAITASAETNGSPGLIIANTDTTPCERWTVTYYSTADSTETIGWRCAFLGAPIEIRHRKQYRGGIGPVALGRAKQSWQLPKRAGAGAALGVGVEYLLAAQQPVTDLRFAIERASRDDDGRMMVLLREAVAAPARAADTNGSAWTPAPELGIVEIVGANFDVDDVGYFQADDPTTALLSFRLELAAVA